MTQFPTNQEKGGASHARNAKYAIVAMPMD